MHRVGVCFCLLLLSWLMGCSEPVPEPEPVALDRWGRPLIWDGTPQPSWQEWVARQGQLREGLPDYYRPAYMPEMENWRPEDFLPAEYLEAPLRDICELPEELKLTVIRSRVSEPEGLERLLEYAERGYVQVMSILGTKFCYSPRGNPPALSRAEGLAWARRAAASGEPYAMFVLSSCMSSIYYRDDHEAAGLTLAEISRGSLWIDEMLYWNWRGAHNLEPLALQVLYRGINDYYYPDAGQHYSAEHSPQAAIEGYKWLRLMELGEALHGYTFARRGAQEVLERWPLMSEAEIAEAERRVEAFLRQYGGGLSRARYRGHGCPHEVDFDQFNQELARYGLHVEPDQPWSPPTYPLPLESAEAALGD